MHDKKKQKKNEITSKLSNVRSKHFVKQNSQRPTQTNETPRIICYEEKQIFAMRKNKALFCFIEKTTPFRYSINTATRSTYVNVVLSTTWRQACMSDTSDCAGRPNRQSLGGKSHMCDILQQTPPTEPCLCTLRQQNPRRKSDWTTHVTLCCQKRTGTYRNKTALNSHLFHEARHRPSYTAAQPSSSTTVKTGRTLVYTLWISGCTWNSSVRARLQLNSHLRHSHQAQFT